MTSFRSSLQMRLAFLALGLGQTVDLDVDLARLLVHAQVLATVHVAVGAVVEAFLRAGVARRELVARGQHLFHQQAGGDRLEHVVHRFGHRGLLGRGLGDQVGEARAVLALGIARGAADDLHHLRQAAAVADGQGVLAPDPVETLLGHAQRDDDVHVVAVILVRRVFQRTQHARALGRVAVVHQVGHLQGATVLACDQVKAGCLGSIPFHSPSACMISLTSRSLSLRLSRELTLGMWTMVFSAGSSTFATAST
jgi:hypothetical protein